MEQVAHDGTWAHDRSISGTDIPWTIDAPHSLIFHDRDVSIEITAAERLLTALGRDIRYMTANEYSGYLHARIKREDQPGRPFFLTVSYDDHYCQYFASHESTWVLHLSDKTREALNAAGPEKQPVAISKGLGMHIVHVGPATQ